MTEVFPQNSCFNISTWESKDGQSLLQELSIGQRCLLYGLVNLCSSSEMSSATGSVYSICNDKSCDVNLKGKKETI